MADVSEYEKGLQFRNQISSGLDWLTAPRENPPDATFPGIGETEFNPKVQRLLDWLTAPRENPPDAAFPGVNVSGDPAVQRMRGFFRMGDPNAAPAEPEPLSAPSPPPTPQPTTPAPGGGFEGGMPFPVSPLLAPAAAMGANQIWQKYAPAPTTPSAPALAQTQEAAPPVGQPELATSYAAQVSRNLNNPFMPKYNSLRYGKPLDFTEGVDSRIRRYTPQTGLGDGQQGVAVEGRGAVQIEDRPMTLAELDPMVVHEKDWGEYLKAMTRAASTPEFDASKDPAVLQQLEQLNTAYWKFKAAKKEQALIEKRRNLLELDAREAEYRAGLKTASAEELAEFQRNRAEEKASFLEKQVRMLGPHNRSREARALRKQAAQIRNNANAEQDMTLRNTNREYQSWWSEQVGRIREGHQKLNEELTGVQLEQDATRQYAGLAGMQLFATGQARDDERRQQEAALAYQTTQRQLMQENKLLARQERQSKAEMAVANNASALAGLKAQKLKDQLNQYESDGFGGFTDRVDGHQLTPEEVQAVKGMYAEFAQLSNQQVGIKENLLSRNLAQNPGAAAYLPVRTPAAAPPSAQPEKVVYPDSSLWMKAKK